jgi:DNA-binding MarR family transcriptional regulator
MDAPNTAEVEAAAQLALENGVRLVRLIRRVVRQNPNFPVSYEALRAIGFLADHPGICLSDLAEYLWIGVPTASKQVDDLVERGFLTRTPDARDRRRVALSVTPEGAHLIATTRRPVQERLAAMFARLDPDEFDRVRAGLDLLHAVLEPTDQEEENA